MHMMQNREIIFSITIDTVMCNGRYFLSNLPTGSPRADDPGLFQRRTLKASLPTHVGPHRTFYMHKFDRDYTRV